MALLSVWDTATDTETLSGTYDATHVTTKAFRVVGGQPLTFYASVRNAVNLQLDFALDPSFDAANPELYGKQQPSLTDELNWFTVGGFDGAVPGGLVPSGTHNVVFPTGRLVVSTADRDVSNEGADVDSIWRGYVPQGAGWMRIKLLGSGPYTADATYPTSYIKLCVNGNNHATSYING